jgi:hypothetical protein
LEYASWCELSRDKLPQPTDDELAAAKAIITSSPSPPTTTDAIDTASKMEAIDRIKKEIALHSGLNFDFLSLSPILLLIQKISGTYQMRCNRFCL